MRENITLDLPRRQIVLRVKELYEAVERLYTLVDSLKPKAQSYIADSLVKKNVLWKLHYFTYSLHEFLEYKAPNDYPDVCFSQVRYVFSLKQQMFYNANLKSILFPMHVKCLALLRSIGEHHYEVEIVAIYQ